MADNGWPKRHLVVYQDVLRPDLEKGWDTRIMCSENDNGCPFTDYVTYEDRKVQKRMPLDIGRAHEQETPSGRQ